MNSFDDSLAALPPHNATEEPAPASWVPDLEERLETIERANAALERVRHLLERVHGVDFPETQTPVD
jgi:hypothetical protein